MNKGKNICPQLKRAIWRPSRVELWARYDEVSGLYQHMEHFPRRWSDDKRTTSVACSIQDIIIDAMGDGQSRYRRPYRSSKIWWGLQSEKEGSTSWTGRQWCQSMTKYGSLPGKDLVQRLCDELDIGTWEHRPQFGPRDWELDRWDPIDINHSGWAKNNIGNAARKELSKRWIKEEVQ